MGVSGCTGWSHADLGDHERLDFAGMRDMWADTEVDHGAATVYGGGGAVGDLRVDELHLVLVILETIYFSITCEEREPDKTVPRTS